MADKTTEKALQSIENEDEFEEFEIEDWDESQEDPANGQLWEQDWDDDNVDEDFAQKLRAELAKSSS
ncbi:hypothetical protein QBZ16_001099 [Prototheca wickerhamii]|uniref:26S proteasome complex subunit SEM1 n=1 Tax=Prototheca wickerhamii TaxID=3111 RepID=A0AAD9IHD1_PROWI|nr:hypothetical protein QBZ16_001099 [Prototheca wickerhamii]